MLAFILLFSVVLGVFGNTLRNGFVWDDNIYVVGNPVYARFDLRRIFTSLANGVEYLPVRDASYAIDYFLWGNSASGFHMSNMFYYWLTVLAVYFLARSIAAFLVPAAGTDDKRPFFTALTTALFFAVHPIHSEVVSFIACRNALLSALLFFLASHLYLHFAMAPADRRGLAYGGALICFLGSLFAKATGIVLPLILCFLLFFLPVQRRWGSFLALMPFFALAGGAFFLFTKIATGAHIIRSDLGWALGGWEAKASKALQIIVFYLGKLLVPTGYSAAYDEAFSKSLTDPNVLATLIGLLIVGVLAVAIRRTRPYLLFSYGWFLVALIPVLNIFATSPVVADRYAFLPSFAFFFLIAAAGIDLAAKVRPYWLFCCGIILMVSWSWLTVARNNVWFSEETLWADTIRVSPGTAMAYANLGRVYFRQGDYARAFELFDKAREIRGDDPHYDHFQGFLAYVRHDYPLAISHLKLALGRKIEFIESLYLLGVIYEELGDVDNAAEYFRFAIRSREPDTGGLRRKAAEHLYALGRKTG